MELLCLICPTFVSLIIYYSKLFKEKIISNKIIFYFIGNLVINLGTILTAYVFFGVREFSFNVTSFVVKYCALAIAFSIIYAIAMGFLPKLRDYCIKLYKSGCKKGKFSIKLFYTKNNSLVDHVFFLGTSVLFFYLLDLAVRQVAITLSSYSWLLQVSAFLFTATFCFTYIFIAYILPKIVSRIFVIFTYVLNIVLYIVNFMLLKIKAEALSLGELNNTAEGKKYLNFVLDKISIPFILVVVISIALAVLNYISLKRAKENKIKMGFIKTGIALVIIVVAVIFVPKTLDAPEDGWSFISSPKYHYDNLIDTPKSLTICGLYEYTLRDIELYFKNKFSKYGSNEEIEKLMKKYETPYEENKYTGIFKDKNLIMIMMESIDNVSITEETMPTLSKMMRDGWDFKSRYSVLHSGGSTIATEFISMTGLYYDNRFYNNMYNNKYANSIPSTFSENGYKSISVHENLGKYYSRDMLHKNMGFNESYFLYEFLDNVVAYSDKQIIENDKVYQKIISKDDKFMTFIITMAAHGPYDDTNAVCNKELGKKHNDLECLNTLAKRTDDMLEALLKRLKEDKLLDDTVIVLYTDHQAYGYNYTQEYLDTLKTIDSEKNIKALPFVIYSSTEKSKQFDDLIVNDIDIVPTIYNLFGIKYNPSEYVGRDIFAKDHTNLLLFSNETWYDGNVYSANSGVDTSTEEYSKNTEYTHDKFELSRMILSNNYYAKKKK